MPHIIAHAKTHAGALKKKKLTVSRANSAFLSLRSHCVHFARESEHKHLFDIFGNMYCLHHSGQRTQNLIEAGTTSHSKGDPAVMYCVRVAGLIFAAAERGGD